MKTRIIIDKFIDTDDDRYPYKKMDVYPREGYVPSDERFAALATGNNKANTIIIANFYEEDDLKGEDAVKPVNFEELTKEQLQGILDEKGIEYKASDKKEALIKLLEGE